jgi:putative nucleotidyltransferase with HDIG domain
VRRILFVDDEPNVLESMRDALRPYRHGWALVFAASGHDALAQLATGPFDVVVSDMRMPGMDGASLLAEIEVRHPQTMRVVLSGYTDVQVAARAASVAHVFLAKPCTSRELMTTVERACAVRDLLAGPALLQVIAAMPALPAVPVAYGRLKLALGDPAGVPRDAAAIARALWASTFGAFAPLEPAGALRVEVLREHSLLVARIAPRLAKDAGLHEDVLCASLLHDVGKLVCAALAPAPFAEQPDRNVTHAEIGAYLLAGWGVPRRVVEAVASHHRPARVPASEVTAATVVHVADAVAHAVAPIAGESDPELDEEHLASLGLGDRLPGWRELATAEAIANGDQLPSMWAGRT